MKSLSIGWVFAFHIQMSLKKRIVLTLKSMFLTSTITLKSTTERLKTKLYDKRATFSIVNLPIISSNLSKAPDWSLYFTTWACVQTLLNRGYVAPRLKSSLQKLCSRYHEMGDRYKISIFQMAMGLFPFT